MPVIRVKVDEKEMRAISEYAAQCGETVPEIVRKTIIRDATLADGFGPESPRYSISMVVPRNCTASAEQRFTERNYNKIRRIMGMGEIRL